MAEQIEKLSFSGAFGHPLAARLHLPIGKPWAYALFAHCFTCGKDLNAVVRIGRALAERGIATLRFDFTGLGESDGDFADTHFSSNIDDLVAAADFLRANYQAPELLIGHSLGGAAVLAAASRVSEVKAVSTIGAPFDPGHVRHLIDDAAPDLEERGESEVVLAGRRFRIKRQFLDDIANQSSQEAIARLGAALLVCHSPQDEIVGVDNAREIFVAARHPKSFISLDGADHLLGRRADSEYVALVLSAWANRYLAAPEETDVPQGTVRVRGGKKNFTQEVVAGPHRLIADEPKSFGGADLGPNPYDYLLAGLGACTTMTVRMYADRKQWPLDAVECSLTHKKIHAKECEDCESESGPVDIIDRTLTLEGDLDEAHRTRLTEIADKCPVHKSLTTETRIRTELKS